MAGWPGISPCELEIVGDQLLLGMMWKSPKALALSVPSILTSSPDTLRERRADVSI